MINEIFETCDLVGLHTMERSSSQLCGCGQVGNMYMMSKGAVCATCVTNAALFPQKGLTGAIITRTSATIFMGPNNKMFNNTREAPSIRTVKQLKNTPRIKLEISESVTPDTVREVIDNPPTVPFIFVLHHNDSSLTAQDIMVNHPDSPFLLISARNNIETKGRRKGISIDKRKLLLNRPLVDVEKDTPENCFFHMYHDGRVILDQNGNPVTKKVKREGKVVDEKVRHEGIKKWVR